MVKKIEYVNKEAIQNDTTIADENKVTDKDMNEIKEVVNNNADELTTAKQDITDIKSKNTEQDSRVSTNENNIKSLQTDNTTNKKDISDIKSKNTAQDTDIETLQQRLNEKDNQIAELKAENEDLKADLSNSQIHGQASGEYVHLSDSAKMECDIAVLGNSKQETRQGYNLLKNKAISQTTNGITATKNSDGSIKYSGICTQTFFMDIDEISLESGTYSLYGFSNGSNNSYMLISALQGIRTLAEQKDKPTPFTLTETLKVIFRVYIFEGAEINETLYPMLINGNDLTKPYEPYGAMPSIDYPSEIEAVGDNKNLSKIDKISTINGGYINTSCGVLGAIEAGETYTISFNCSTKHTGTNVIYLRVPVGSSYENQTNLNYSSGKRISKTFTAINSGELSLSASLGTDYTNVLYDIKLEKGTVATSYSSYNCGSTNVKVCNKNLFDKNNYTIFEGNIENNIVNKDDTRHKWVVLKMKENIEIRTYGKKITTNVGQIVCLPKYPAVGVKLLSYAGYPNYNKIKTAKGTKYIMVYLGAAYETTFTSVEDLVNYLIVENATEDLTETDYIPHEEQNYPVDMQEPFKEVGKVRDCFVLKEDGKWYERHKVGEYIFTGNEDISNQVYSDVNVYSIHKSNIANINAEWKSTELKSNLFKAVTEISKKGELAVGANYINFYYDDNVDVNGFKTWLSEQYSKGIPLKIQYLLLTPIDIECTEQQTQQLQALQKAKTYKNITNITTDTIAVLDVDYKKDLETIINNINTAIVSLGGV